MACWVSLSHVLICNSSSVFPNLDLFNEIIYFELCLSVWVIVVSVLNLFQDTTITKHRVSVGEDLT